MVGSSLDIEPPPPPLLDLIASGEKEVVLVETIRSYSILEENHTAPPWSVHHVYKYLEAVRPSDGWTALHVCAERGYPLLCTAVVAGALPGQIHAKDFMGLTALMVAARGGKTACVEALLTAGAAVEMTDNSGKTVLHHAVQDSRDAVAILSRLIAAGANIEARDDNGLTPLMVAVALNISACCDSLLEHGAKVLAFDRDGRTVLDFAHSSRRSAERTGATSARGLGTAKRPPTWHRWDSLGETNAQKTVLLQERLARRSAAPGLDRGDRYRLIAGKPRLV
eukprot:TRINITY_DN64582_c0_g1_i1.p1 TRINITY_DN64582_c0_g1~~TRINITY_DN64582_c0_g1_i1.p1  ORF type:complete len:281 (+),score=47.85 TRINITY_DN64582_c0_g1_i1:67-909(+)